MIEEKIKGNQDILMLVDPATGKKEPYPSHASQYRKFHGKIAWLYNPWTGEKRNANDIGFDCFGYLILVGENNG